jgi:cysteine-rich repeat protein
MPPATCWRPAPRRIPGRASTSLVKLARDSGNELWRRQIDGTSTDEDNYYADVATALAVDAAGDVVAAGQTVNVDTGLDFTVVKLAGGTGALRWQRDVNGLGTHFGGHDFPDQARAVAIDAAGDVVAAGVTENVIDFHFSGDDFSVVKFAGADGSELWRSGPDGELGFDSANAVAVDLDGNVLSAGNVETRPGYDGFAVRKLAGANGALLWEQFLSSPAGTSGRAYAIALEPNGDAVAAGATSVGGERFAVARFSGATGAELWRHESPGYSYAAAYVMAVDPFGDVIAAGTDVVKLSGATGAELWRLGSERYTFLTHLALDAAGNPVVGGAYDTDAGSYSFTVLKLFGTTGGTFPCGDGVLDAIDQCDDGNLIDGDGCDSNCTPTACGNGIVTSGESCDDGNLTGGDGCDVVCSVETGWSCVHRPSFCREVCGDGVLTPSETCDDANLVDGDGCDSNCTPTGCGNDVVTSGEVCDDGNLVDNDGCNADCKRSRCGDGFLWTYGDKPEECDDGNPVDGDGCDSNCKMTRCGNGVVTVGEECDDGNLAERDGCSPICTVQCDPYAGRRGCRRRFHVARAFQPGVPSYFPSGADALAVLAPDVVVGDRYGGHADLFSADPSAATFGSSLHVFALPRGPGPIGTLGPNLLVARTGAAFLYDRAGALLRTYRLPHGGEPAAIAGSADWVAVGVPERQAVYLFDAASGVLIQTLTGNVAEGARFGFAIALGANGAVAVGAPGVCPGPGAVYLYDGATGALRHTIANPDPVLDGAACADSFRRDAGFGHALATVGTDFVAGNPIAAAAYRFDGSSGALLTTFLPAPNRAGEFGTAVAAFGADVLVGAPGIPFRDDSYTNGMAYLFDGASGELLWPFHNPTFERNETETFGASVTGVGNDVVIGDPRDHNDTSGPWGTAYLFIETTACGNATLDPGEQCDDGNLTNGDGCDENCATTGCGNSVVTAGEVCDDGDRVSGDGCDSDCTISRCGNGLVPPYTEFGEECDDANAVDGDGCSDCRRDPGWGCGGEPSVCAQCGAGTARVAKPRLALRHLDTAAEDDTLRLRGELVLPSFDPPLDLTRSGFRLIVDTAYRNLLDVTVPGGRFTSPPGAGWTADRRGTRWLYRDRGAARHGGITRVLMQTTSEPGHLRFRIEGAAGAFAVASYELPLEIQLGLDPGAPELGQCAELAVPDFATGVRCSFTMRNRGFSCQ